MSQRWNLVAASAVGLMVHYVPTVFYTFGIFLVPLTVDFGWQRSEASLFLAIVVLVVVVSLPIAGHLTDRFGARRVVLPSLFFLGLTVATLSLLPGELWLWYTIAVPIGFLGACSGTLPYAKVVTATFARNRGLALGLSVTGIGLGALVMPLVADRMIESSGWRAAYGALALIIILLGWPIVWKFFKNVQHGAATGGRSIINPGDSDTISTEDVASTTARRAFKTQTFWILAVAFFLPAAAITGFIVHLSPLLIDSGVSTRSAAFAVSLIGMASIGGRLFAGLLLDYIHASIVAISFFLLSAVACAMLFFHVSTMIGYLSAVLLGLGVGAEIDVVAYIVSKYFGRIHFGQIYGYLYASFSLGTAAAPPLMGYSYDVVGSYDAAIVVCGVMLLVACLLLAFLGPYPVSKKPIADTLLLDKSSSKTGTCQ